MVVETASNVLHVLFAAAWVGAVLFVALAVLPLARDGDLDPDALGSIVDSLRTLSRTSALVLLLTGGHLAGTRYTADSLVATGRGHLVLTMVALWLVLAAVVEVGAGRIEDGLDERKLREPARRGLRWFRVASVVGVLLLVDGALLT